MNKKVFNLLFICFVGLFLVSAAYAAENSSDAESVLTVKNAEYTVTSDLSNENIQTMFDNANDGDTFKFTSKEYKDISLVVDKKLNIISKKSSVVYASDKVSDKAKSMGISKTFGFYFTSNSAGSVLSGITIKAPGCDNAIIVDKASDVTIKNNVITGSKNAVLVKNSEKITLSNNKISQASENGVQLQNVKENLVSGNTIWKNGRSGIEINSMENCTILRNEIHHNSFNGISMYGHTSWNLIKFNKIHNNTNGLYINSVTSHDEVIANTLSHNRRDPFFELGPDESGNGLLFGDQFRSKKDDSKLLVKNNAMIHNEQYQAKNNPANEKFQLDQNWFDSADEEHTFVCPMLLAKILKLDAITIKNGIGLQMKDDNGNPVDEMGVFDVDVDIDGNRYTATVGEDGKAEILSKNIEPNTKQDVQINLGDNNNRHVVKKDVTSGPERYEAPAHSDTQKENDDSGENSKNSAAVEGTGGGNGNGQGNGNGDGTGDGNGNGSSSNADLTNSGFSGKYGSNSSDIFSSDSSLTGENAISNGDSNTGASGEGSSGDGAKAYEIVPEKQISKSVVDTSGVVVLSIVALLGCFVYGYKRKEEFD